MDTRALMVVLGLALLAVGSILTNRYLTNRYQQAAKEMQTARRWLIGMNAASLGVNAIVLAFQIYQCSSRRRAENGAGGQTVIVKYPGSRPRVIRRDTWGRGRESL
jgi:hypothetical protein